MSKASWQSCPDSAMRVVMGRSLGTLETEPSEQCRQSWCSLGLGFSRLKAALVPLQPRGSVSLRKVSSKNCRLVLKICCKRFVSSHMGNLWQAGNTMWTSISQPCVLITSLYFPDTHLLSYFFLYQKHSLHMSVFFFPQQIYTGESLLQAISLLKILRVF